MRYIDSEINGNCYNTSNNPISLPTNSHPQCLTGAEGAIYPYSVIQLKLNSTGRLYICLDQIHLTSQTVQVSNERSFNKYNYVVAKFN